MSISQKIHTNISESDTEDISYIVLLEDWYILQNKLNVLDRTLGAGKIGIVKHGLYTLQKMMIHWMLLLRC